LFLLVVVVVVVVVFFFFFFFYLTHIICNPKLLQPGLPGKKKLKLKGEAMTF
jgi:hypothetical protein